MRTRRIKLIITVDTEADNQWRTDAGLNLHNLDFIPRFHTLCTRYGFKVTYLCTYEVVQSRKFEHTLRPYEDDGSAEIGAHLHPWSNPPFDRDPSVEAMSRPYPSDLAPSVYRQKMEVLTESIVKRGGRSPASYRAGRYGLAGEHVPVLLSLGYKADCSVTPLVSWRHAGDGAAEAPDFSRAPSDPYFLDPRDVCRPGASLLLEVPITILYLNRLMKNRTLRKQTTKLRRRRLLYGVTERLSLDPTPRWFRPLPEMSAKRLLHVYRTAIRRGLPVVELMLHSSELMPGGSPYNPTPASIENLYQRLETVFQVLSRDGCETVTLSEFARSYHR